MRQIKKIIGGMLCCVLITGLFSVPVDASKKKAATTDTETTETDTTKQDDKDKKETSTTTTHVTSSAKPKDGEISKVIVESYEIEGDTSPGDEFTIKVTIQNTSSQFDAKDIVGFMYFPNGGLYIQNGEANEKFCAVLAPGETTVLEYKLGVAETCLDDTALIELDIDYFSNNNANVTNANFTPAIVQSGDLSIDLLSVAKSVENGTKLLVSTRYENKGEKDIKKVLFSQEDIVAKTKELGQQLTEDYAEKNPLLVCVLKGAVPFMAELIKHIDTHIEMDFMVVSSYGGGTVSSGEVKILKDVDTNVEGRDIIFIEDIIDTGRTLLYLRDMFKYRKANSVKIATLFDKPEGRVVDIEADYVCYDVPNEFIVGFGLDYDEKYRNLPYVGVLKEEIYNK